MQRKGETEMTREEAIRILDPKTTGEALAEIEYYGGFSGRAAAVQAVSDACILAVAALREQEQRRWIPVTERLPKLIPSRAGTAYSEAVNVLTSGRKVFTAIFNGTCWIGAFGFWDALDEKITHWTPVLLPLPEPQKEESEEEEWIE